MTNRQYPHHTSIQGGSLHVGPVQGGPVPGGLGSVGDPQLIAPAPLAAPLNAPPRVAPIVAPRSNGRLYALAWVAAGLLSAGYVATIIRQPDAVGNIVMRPDAPTTNLGRIAQGVAKTEADVQVLKQAVTALQGGLIDVKSRADAIDARERQLVERIGAVETRVEQFAVASVAVPTEPVKKGAAAAASVPQPKAPATKAAVAPKLINQPDAAAPKAIETASIPVPASPVPAAKTPAESAANAAAALADAPKGVVVASGPSVDALRLSWSLLSDRHKATFGKMEPRVVTTDGSTYQLVAGPLPSEAEANKVCTGLKARGIACRPGEFRGDALQ